MQRNILQDPTKHSEINHQPPPMPKRGSEWRPEEPEYADAPKTIISLQFPSWIFPLKTGGSSATRSPWILSFSIPLVGFKTI